MRRGDSEGEEGHSDFPDTQVVEGPVVREMVHWRELVNAMVYSHQRAEDEDGHIRYHTPEADFDKAAATVYVSSRKDCCSGLADVDTVVGGPGSRHSSDLSVDTVFAKEHNYLVDNGAGVADVAVVVEVVEAVDRHIVAEQSMEDNMTLWEKRKITGKKEEEHTGKESGRPCERTRIKGGKKDREGEKGCRLII